MGRCARQWQAMRGSHSEGHACITGALADWRCAANFSASWSMMDGRPRGLPVWFLPAASVPAKAETLAGQAREELHAGRRGESSAQAATTGRGQGVRAGGEACLGHASGAASPCRPPRPNSDAGVPQRCHQPALGYRAWQSGCLWERHHLRPPERVRGGHTTAGCGVHTARWAGKLWCV
jgi:hypothetical protein